MTQLTHEQKMEMLFIALVEQWQAQAWIALGKMPNPVSNKVERNLEAAKMAIDMLDMLKEKTTGNLSDNETRMLTKVIADLKLNYVDEYEREKREKKQQTSSDTTSEKEKEKAEESKESPSREKEEAQQKEQKQEG